MIVFPIIVLASFTYLSFFRNEPERSTAITRADWMLMWGAILGYISTVALGIVALHQSNQANRSANAANQMTRHLIEIEHRERLAFAGIESTKPLLIHLNNSNQKKFEYFKNEMSAMKTWINAEFCNNMLTDFDYYQDDNDYLLCTFNIKTLNSNHIKNIKVNSIVITSTNNNTAFPSKKVWTDCGQFLESGNSYKVSLVIHGLTNLLLEKKQNITDSLFPEFELFINVTIENLYGDQVEIDWSMAAEEGEILANSGDNTVYQYQLENIGFQVQDKNMSAILNMNKF